MATAARRFPTLMLLAGILVLAFLIHVGWGGNWLSPLQVLREIVHGVVSGDRSNAVVWDLRLPRAIACVFEGAILAMVGASFQSLFRNPLADPFIVGVSSGSAVGGVFAIFLGLSAVVGGFGIVGFAFFGGLGSLMLVLALSRKRGVSDVTSLLLAGVVVGSLLNAVMTLLLYAAGQDTLKVLQWLMGSMTPMFWSRVATLGIATLIGAPILISQTRTMNAFAISDDTAQHLGINIGRLKAVILVTGTCLIAVAVGAAGIIGFLGLVSPHIARRLVGVDWRASLPAAMLIGPTILLGADVLAQRLIGGMELPVGAVIALIGAPFLLLLLRRDPVAA